MVFPPKAKQKAFAKGKQVPSLHNNNSLTWYGGCFQKILPLETAAARQGARD